MTCPSCGTANEPGRKFCGECGTRLAVICGVCGTANTPGNRFCGECGTRLDEATATGSATGAAHTASAPGGVGVSPVAERRLVSVLFADLVGFTTLAEGRDAEAVRDMLSAYFDTARTVIERYGGTVEKFIGDAVMAVWGAPIAHEDDAERAVRAALDLLVDVRALGPEVQARAGVMTGEAAVTLGAVGQGMVAGDLVNTASRLQSVAPPGSVLVGEATQRAASQAIAFEAAGAQQLKGKDAPVPAYVALRVVSKRKGAGRTDRLEAPFVGRDAQLRLLKDVFHATGKEQRARLVSITGQAGIGKTRLAWEFQKYVDGVVEGVWWHEGRSPSYGEGVTFWALGEMIRSRAGLLETDGVETTREKVAATVQEHVPDPDERASIEPALLALLGAGDPPPGGRDELFRAWRTFFERMAATGTVGLLFEDVQWADPGLLDFIDHLLEWSRGVPILIVTLARPDLLERRPDWGAGRRNFIALELEPLDEADMREVLRGLVPGLPADTVRSIIARADGIPLYAVETIRMLVADGRLRETETGYEPVGALGELAVPETLQALIAARLDALDPADRALLQDAAVLGHSFTLAGLEAVTRESKESLAGRLRLLARADLVNQDVDPRSPERGMYAFVQALIREVAYGTLAKRDRRDRHLAAARFFESLGDDELAGALAAHYLAAYEAAPDGPEGEALGTQARISLVAAADRAIALGSPEQALAFLGQAKRVAADPAERAEILERAGRAALAALRLEEGQEVLREAIDLRRSLGQTRETFAAINELASAYIIGRHPAAAGALIESVLDEVERAGDADRAALYTRLARARFGEDRLDESLRFADLGLQLSERLEMHEVVVEGLIVRGGTLSKLGRPAEALALTEGARRLAQDQGFANWELRATIQLSLLVATGDPRAAVALAGTGIELAQRIGRRGEQLLLIGNAGEDAFRVGDWDWQTSQIETLDHLELDEGTLLTMQLASLVVTYVRGSVDYDSLVERLDSAQQSFEDPDTESARWDVRAWLDFADGRFSKAHANWTKVTEVSALNTPYVLPRIAHTSLLLGDAAGAADALDRLLKTSARGRAVDVDKVAIEAGIAAIEGRSADALAGFRSALAGWRDLGLVWDEVLTSLVFATLMGADLPEARRAAETARELMAARGGVKIVTLLDAALGSAEAPPAARAADEVTAAS